MKRRIARLSFYSIYCMLGLAGLLLDFGVIGGSLHTRPFVFYTSLSNMVCTAFMIVSLVRTIQSGDSDFAPLCKFLFVVMILVTAIVYNLLLNSYSSWIAYFSAVKNCLYHLILPVMFFLDWLLFYRRGSIKELQPLLTAVIPFTYVVYILIRAAAVKSTGVTVSVLYPYFFLNVDRLGWRSFVVWMGLLLVALIALSYALYGLDRLLCKKELKV